MVWHVNSARLKLVLLGRQFSTENGRKRQVALQRRDKIVGLGTAQSVARLTLVRKVVSSSPTAGMLTRPSIPPWVGKMSTWQMMAIGSTLPCPACSPES